MFLRYGSIENHATVSFLATMLARMLVPFCNIKVHEFGARHFWSVHVLILYGPSFKLKLELASKVLRERARDTTHI